MKSKTVKPTPAPTSPTSGRHVVQMVGTPEKRERLIADPATEGLFSDAATLKTFTTKVVGDIGITETIQSLRASLANINRGDLRAVETMLLNQAVALNSVSAELEQRSPQT